MISLERETLNQIQTASPFQNYPGLRSEAEKLHRATKDHFENLSFYCEISMYLGLRAKPSAEKVKQKIAIGGVVIGRKSDDCVLQSSYSFCLFKKDTIDSAIQRKVHFDFENPSTTNRNEPKPFHHLQICGKPAPKLASTPGFKHERLSALYPKLEKPRIHTPPMSLGLFLDWVFTEFPAERSADLVRNDSGWCSHVITAEKLLLKPYYKAGHDYFNASGQGGGVRPVSTFMRSQIYNE